MSLLSPIKDHHAERQLFISRVILAAVVSLLLVGVVIARLVQLQVIDHEIFAAKSQGNRVRIEAVPPIRGLVLDREGRVLAENLPAYQLEMIPEQVADVDDTLSRLAGIGLIEADDIPRFKALSRSGPRFKPVTLKLTLTEEEIANFAIQRPRFPGVDFQPRLVRHYPNGPEVAHVVGYVGAVSADDLQRLDAARYAGSSHTGKTGVEASYESSLHGFAGFRHLVTNARGREVPGDSSQLLGTLPPDQSPEPGHNLYLTIDLDLQRIAVRALEGRRGALVALDPWTGEVLALVSAPAFDPNLFAVGMTAAQYAGLQGDPDRPLFNRAVRGTYPPGSTIKPMLALAALETGATNLTRRSFCPGYFMLPNSTHRYRDWKPEGHGPVDLHDAISQSCDVYFYEISNTIGIDNIHDYLGRFGMGQLSGIDIGGEAAGLVPSRAWKQKAFNNRDDKRWYDGETPYAQSTGSRQIFGLEAGETHWMVDFDDPRSGHSLEERRSGKLKVVRFPATSRLVDKRDRSRPGCLGYSLYTWRASDVDGLWKLVQAGGATQVTDVLPDEFGSRSFSFVAPDGYHWTLLQA